MAGYWIKMRVNLDRDPKISAIAQLLAEDSGFCAWLGDPVRRQFTNAFDHIAPSVTRDIAVASLLRFWGVAIEQGKRDGDDLIVTCCDGFDVDEISGVPGMGNAMESVGWAEYSEDANGLTQTRLPKFLLENLPTNERKKQQSRDSSKRHRDKKKPVTTASRVTPKSDPREEKIREEEKRVEKSVTGPNSTSPPDLTPSPNSGNSGDAAQGDEGIRIGRKDQAWIQAGTLRIMEAVGMTPERAVQERLPVEALLRNLVHRNDRADRVKEWTDEVRKKKADKCVRNPMAAWTAWVKKEIARL